MTKKITLEITDTEYRCLEYIAQEPDDFVDNAATSRAKTAKEEILNLLMAHCNENSISIATGEDAQIEQAFTLGVVKTAKQRTEEADKEESK
jgi:hypothetical protein